MQPKKDGPMILSTIRMAIPRRKRDEALKILTMSAEYSRVRPGCLSCHIYGDLQDAGIIMVKELWRSMDELEQHLRSDAYRNVLLVMEMAEQQPELRFDTISDSTGIETVEKARSRGPAQSP
jgi:quinol monooxygenase YgiN